MYNNPFPCLRHFILFSMILSSFLSTIFARPPLGLRRPISTNRKLSPRAGAWEYCKVFPDGIIPYCFPKGTYQVFRDLFREGTERWTKNNIPVDFSDIGDCPSQEDTKGSWQLGDMIDLVVVLVEKVTPTDLRPFEASYGYNEFPGEALANGDRVLIETHQALANYLIMLYGSTLYPIHFNEQLEPIEPYRTHYVTAIARAIGNILCLKLEHKVPDGNDLQFDFMALKEYEDGDDEIKRAILASQNDMTKAYQLVKKGIKGPAFYAKLDPEYQFRNGSKFDPKSIMLVDGREYASPGRRVISTSGGHRIDINANSYPSENDIKMVRDIWSIYAGWYHRSTPDPNPPTYDEAQSDPCPPYTPPLNPSVIPTPPQPTY